MKENVAIIIPAYNPEDILEKVIKDLKKSQYKNIIVVDDGSESKKIFSKIEKDVTLLKHERNQGQGRAIKTAMEYCFKNIKDIIGIITVDADGQHIVKDINKVYEVFQRKRESFILGTRNFDKENVPFKSEIGNKLTSYILKVKTKQKIRDTQTGLKAIPFKYLEDLYTKVEGEKFEYAISTILYFIENNIDIVEVEIETIYFNNNKATNYKAIKDSIKIYNVINKFGK